MEKIGIITFHNSYNCGSMLESYAIQHYLEKNGYNNEIIDYSSEGQKQLYSVFEKNTSIKNVLKNIILLPHYKHIKNNNLKYEKFKEKNMLLSKKYNNKAMLNNSEYDCIVAGSDQIWNITIEDFDFAYFIDFCDKCKKIAYAPSFGAKNPKKYASKEDYKKISYLLSKFDYISIRENNGKKWLKDNFNIDANVLIDPTLLLDVTDYSLLESDYDKYEKENYIFLYCPSFNINVCKLVKKISKKYKLKVLTWSSKSYYKKFIRKFGFNLVDFEDPSLYLKLIKDAKLVITTSFHGTIFSTLYEKKFFTIKNGEMFGDDDRVRTLINNLSLNERLITSKFDENYDYLREIDFSPVKKKIDNLKKETDIFFKKALGEFYEIRK